MTEPPWAAHALAAGRAALHLSGAALLVALGIGSCTALSSLADHRRAEKAAAAPAVVTAAVTKEAAKIPTVTLQAPVQVERLTDKQAAVLEKRYHQPAGTLHQPPLRSGSRPRAPNGRSDGSGSTPDGGGAGGALPARPSAGASGGSDMGGVAPGALHVFPEQKISPEPWGATALPTLDAAGKFSLLVAATPRPWFQLGGRRRAGVSWDAFRQTGGGFVEQDFFSLRLGSQRALVIGIRPFATYGYAAAPGARAFDYGLPITAAIDF